MPDGADWLTETCYPWHLPCGSKWGEALATSVYHVYGKPWSYKPNFKIQDPRSRIQDSVIFLSLNKTEWSNLLNCAVTELTTLWPRETVSIGLFEMYEVFYEHTNHMLLQEAYSSPCQRNQFRSSTEYVERVDCVPLVIPCMQKDWSHQWQMEPPPWGIVGMLIGPCFQALLLVTHVVSSHNSRRLSSYSLPVVARSHKWIAHLGLSMKAVQWNSLKVAHLSHSKSSICKCIHFMFCCKKNTPPKWFVICTIFYLAF